MKKVLYILLFSVATSACEKAPQTTSVVGNVIDLTKQAPISNQEVFLVQVETPPTPFAPISRSIIQETTTNSNGGFSFNFDAEMDSGIEYLVEMPDEPGYFSDAWQEGDYEMVVRSIEVEKGVINETNLKVVPTGSVLLSVKNTTNGSVSFEMFLKNDFLRIRKFLRTVPPSSEAFNSLGSQFPSGVCTMVWYTEVNGTSDSVEIQIVIPHQDRVEYEFVY